MTLTARLEARIAREGSISIAEFMESALVDSEFGYYMTRDPFGKDGDFVTSPEISQIFGELVGAWLAATWQQLGSPRCVLAEPGPGRGTLMKDILRATAKVPGFHDAVDVWMMEASPVLEAMQKQQLKDAHPRIRWCRQFSDLPSLPLLLVANEFFDALPIRQFIFQNGIWYERMVIRDENGFNFSFGDTRTHPGVAEPVPGMIYESCEAGDTIARQIAARIAAVGGAALIVDYGYAGGSRGDTLQAMKDHAYTDILAEPGNADITAHVNFDSLCTQARHAGAIVYGPLLQGIFLRRLGAELRATALCAQTDMAGREKILKGLERIVSPEHMGELFKVIAILPRQMPAPAGFAQP